MRDRIVLIALFTLVLPAIGGTAAAGGPPAHAGGPGEADPAQPPGDAGEDASDEGKEDGADRSSDRSPSTRASPRATGPPAHARDEHADPPAEEARAGEEEQDDEPSSPSEEAETREEGTAPAESGEGSSTEDPDPETDGSAPASEERADPGTGEPATLALTSRQGPDRSSSVDGAAPKGPVSEPSSAVGLTSPAPLAPLHPRTAPTSEPSPSTAAGLASPTPPSTSTVWLLPGALLGAVGALAVLHRRQAPLGPDLGPLPPRAPEADPEPGRDPEPEEQPPSDPASATELPEGGPDGLLELGSEALDRGEVETAASWFETAIALQPGLQAAHFCLGLCLDELGRLEEAEDALGNACRLSPEDALAHGMHASVLARLGRTRGAVAKLEQVADTMPELLDAIRDDEAFAPLHDHPRFLALLGELDVEVG